ncbi:MAG: hypothetical protein O7G85_11590 [Planctomycetota bacterium]|nr:hypothetical protein [Planctomycetota bacterium]
MSADQEPRIEASREHLLQDVRRLQASRSYRDESRRFAIEGVRNFIHAVEHGAQLETIIVCKRLRRTPKAQRIVRTLRKTGPPIVSISCKQFRSIALLERASGIAAIVHQPWRTLADCSPSHGICWLALERVRSPGNLGTVLRTSSAIGAAGVICLGDAIDPFEPAWGLISDKHSFDAIMPRFAPGSVTIKGE